MVMFNIGDLLYHEGNLVPARKTLDEVIVTARPAGFLQTLEWSSWRLGDVLSASGDVSGARKSYDAAMATAKAMSDKAMLARVDISLAMLSLQEDHSVEAEQYARSSLAELARGMDFDVEASARAGLAEALLARGKQTEARQEIDRASQIIQKVYVRDVKISVAIAAARVRAASGRDDRAEAIQSLKTIIAEARKIGFLDRQLEARLVLGEIDSASSNVPYNDSLAAIQVEAQARGYGLIAREASARMRRELGPLSTSRPSTQR
jgi:ATP/maltotriose-dependent transcriptional regulator MalT